MNTNYDGSAKIVREPFSSLDFGTKPSTTQLAEVVVVVNPEMVSGYSQSYLREAERVNPLKTKTLKLTEEEMTDYLLGLLKIRVDSLKAQGSKDWRVAKQFVIPDFFQFVLSMIGNYVDHLHGLKFIPEFESKYDIDSMLNTSLKIESLIYDGLTASKDAMPRNTVGDADTMGYIILNDYVHGRHHDQSPIASYVAAFLGFKLKEEASFKMLYRVRYDDVQFITQSLLHERSILCNI